MVKRLKCQHYTQVVKMLTMATLYTSGYKVKDVTILNKWLKGYKCQHYTYVVSMLSISTLYTSGLKVSMSSLYTSN